jgi:putative hydrolase of the HAD superfamily
VRVRDRTAQAIITDIGGVLTPPPVLAVASFVAGRGLALEDVARCVRRHAEATGTDPLVELELGRLSERAFVGLVAEAVERDLGLRVRLGDFSDRYFAEVELNEELFAELAVHERDGVRLGVLTNNAREWHERWLAMPAFGMFDIFVNSALEGVRKPDPAIYRIALDRLGMRAQECVFIDDLAVNCAPARELGMRAVRFTTNAQAIAELRDAVGAQADGVR